MNKRRKKSYCFNCNVSLGKEDNFCRRCGQENHDKKVSFIMLVNDFLGDYFTFDSKVWKSLKLLCFSPGQLTSLYSEGQIMNYIRPIRLMLFLSLIYVVCFSLYLDNTDPLISNDGIHIGNEKSAGATYAEVISKYKNIDDYIEEEKSNESTLNKILIKGIYNLVGGNKNVFNEGLKKTSNLMFFLLPLLGLVFKWSFWRSEMFYVEHFVHVLHLYSFFFAVAIIGLLFSWLFSVPFYVFLLVLLSFYIYLFVSFKKVYNRSKIITFFKVITTTLIFLVMLSVGFIASLIITISIS